MVSLDLKLFYTFTKIMFVHRPWYIIYINREIILQPDIENFKRSVDDILTRSLKLSIIKADRPPELQCKLSIAPCLICLFAVFKTIHRDSHLTAKTRIFFSISVSIIFQSSKLFNVFWHCFYRFLSLPLSIIGKIRI